VGLAASLARFAPVMADALFSRQRELNRIGLKT
jgi:hypothetical protein